MPSRRVRDWAANLGHILAWTGNCEFAFQEILRTGRIQTQTDQEHARRAIADAITQTLNARRPARMMQTDPRAVVEDLLTIIEHTIERLMIERKESRAEVLAFMMKVAAERMSSLFR